MIALVGAFSLPCGAGIMSTIASRSSTIPIPLFALVFIASLQSSPIVCSISSFTLSGSAAGRSILFKTGIRVKSFSKAI